MAQNKTEQKSSAKVPRRKPTLKQKKFVEEYLSNGGNATKAAMAVYDTNDSKVAGSIGTENLAKPVILNMLNSHEQEAERVIIEIMESKHELGQTKLAAAKLLLAYTRGNPVSRNENINVSVSLEDILAS